MKRSAAILLSLLLLLEWGGYRLVLSGLREQARGCLQARLDNRVYDPAGLITMKVAAPHLSTYTQQNREFSRVNGEISIDGVQYSYVKKRFYNDTLEFVCIADPAATRLVAAQNELGNHFGYSSFDGSKKTGYFSEPTREFSSSSYIYENAFPGLSDRQTDLAGIAYNPVNAGARAGFLRVADPPPDRILP